MIFKDFYWSGQSCATLNLSSIYEESEMDFKKLNKSEQFSNFRYGLRDLVLCNVFQRPSLLVPSSFGESSIVVLNIMHNIT